MSSASNRFSHDMHKKQEDSRSAGRKEKRALVLALIGHTDQSKVSNTKPKILSTSVGKIMSPASHLAKCVLSTMCELIFISNGQ